MYVCGVRAPVWLEKNDTSIKQLLDMIVHLVADLLFPILVSATV